MTQNEKKQFQMINAFPFWCNGWWDITTLNRLGADAATFIRRSQSSHQSHLLFFCLIHKLVAIWWLTCNPWRWHHRISLHTTQGELLYVNDKFVILWIDTCNTAKKALQMSFGIKLILVNLIFLYYTLTMVVTICYIIGNTFKVIWLIPFSVMPNINVSCVPPSSDYSYG